MTRRYDAMPRSLAELHEILWSDVTMLYQRWTTFTALYSKQDTVNLLNEAAGGFFELLQRVLLDDLYLGIARLADRPVNRHQSNVVLRSLLDAVPAQEAELRARLDAAVSAYEDAAKFADLIRHKRLAHRDQAVAYGSSQALDFFVSPQDIEKALAAAGMVLNELDNHYEGHVTAFSEFIHTSGADSLVHYLTRAQGLVEQARVSRPQ